MFRFSKANMSPRKSFGGEQTTCPRLVGRASRICNTPFWEQEKTHDRKERNAVLTTEERTAQIKIEVTPELHKRVKIRATELGTTITNYVTDAVEGKLVAENEKPEK